MLCLRRSCSSLVTRSGEHGFRGRSVHAVMVIGSSSRRSLSHNTSRQSRTTSPYSWWGVPVATGLLVAATSWNVSCAQLEASDAVKRRPQYPFVLSTGFSDQTKTSDAADNDDDDDDSSTTRVINWSGTHEVQVPNAYYWEPESIEDVQRILEDCHAKGQQVRPVGSSLSPNGLALSSQGMMSLALLDNVVEINTKSSPPTITVQAGRTVANVLEALRPHNLTLPNLASIAEQQMGGFVQVGAHGTGRLIAPVDHYVTKLKLVTPTQGVVTLSKETDGGLFELAKVGLGCLGVVVEVTMECVPAHNLVEHTFCLSRKQAREQLDDLLKKHKHMRYMWIPYTDTVVVVTNDPEGDTPLEQEKPAMAYAQASKPLTDLLIELSKNSSNPYTEESLAGMGFGELRDALLAINPLDVEHVRRCNHAEAEFWKNSEGFQTKPSDQLLQFDCGGQQWVLEVCFPTGTQTHNNHSDMTFMNRLLAGIEANKIPAPAPIEQRWTAASSSRLSPAHGPPGSLYSWVGIIQYLPPDVDETSTKQRSDITNVFTTRYSDLLRSVGKPMGAVPHWAKLEAPATMWRAVDTKTMLTNRYGATIQAFNKQRGLWDPKNILANRLVNASLGYPIVSSDDGSEKSSKNNDSS